MHRRAPAGHGQRLAGRTGVPRLRRLLAALVAYLALSGVTGFNARITVFGPETFTRKTGAPVTETRTFSVPSPTNPYTLVVTNHGVTSAVIKLNGQVVLRPADFRGSNSNAVLQRLVTLQTGSNEIAVELELRSKPGTWLTVEIVGEQVNQPPFARIAPVTDAFVGQPVLLDGSASSDPEGVALSYTWTLESRPAGSSAVIVDSTSPRASFVPDRKGSYRIMLVVSDGSLTAQDAIDVTTENTPPVARAGSDQTVGVLDNVRLTGEASSDVDGDALTYVWAIQSRPNGSVVDLSNPTDVNPTFYPDIPGDYTIELRVSDGITVSAPDTVLANHDGQLTAGRKRRT